MGVIADKVYHVHPVVLAVIAAAPMFGNLSSLLWSRWARGRRKVPFITGLQTATLLLVGLVALAPDGAAGAWVLVSALVGVRLLLSGEITLRSMVWSLNYPRETRARLTGRLQIMTTLVLAGTSFLAGALLDREPDSFRVAYAVAMGISVLGVAAFARVPHIGEEEQLALERETEDDGTRRRAPGMWTILRADPLFARYQACQFALGVSNMMLEGSLVYLVSRRLEAGYAWSVAIAVGIPMLLATATLPFWAAYIDRVHVARFRVTQSGFWIGYQLLWWLGAWQESLLGLAIARGVLGLARGGGALAWQLGHNDFSSPRDLGAYMGVHVTLTGVRGAFAPLLGVLLYAGSAGGEIPGTGVSLPTFDGMGAQVYGVCCGLCVASAVGFARLERRVRREAS